MLYIQISANRQFLVSEYWILIPLILAVDIGIIVVVKKKRARKQLQLERLKQESKKWKIFYIATGNILAALKIKGGDDAVLNYVNYTYPNCIVGKGFRYVNDKRLRFIAGLLFHSKAKEGVIFITKTALCHLAKQYGLNLPAWAFLPEANVPKELVLLSSWRQLSWDQLIGKFLSVVALGIPLPMLVLANGPVAIIASLAAGSFGVVMMAFTKDPGFLIIPTNLISASVDSIRPRIPGEIDLVSVDLEPVSRGKITMPEITNRYECSLPDQIIGNPKCSEIANISANANITLDYNEVVNMQDVTYLEKVQFDDKYQVLGDKKSTPKFKLRGSKRLYDKAKAVNFLDKFADPKSIPDTEPWDIVNPSSQERVRIRNNDKEL